MKQQENKQLEIPGGVCLTLRKSNKVMNYWQIGYYNHSKWITILQLGTPEKMIRDLKETRTQQKHVSNSFIKEQGENND